MRLAAEGRKVVISWREKRKKEKKEGKKTPRRPKERLQQRRGEEGPIPDWPSLALAR